MEIIKLSQESWSELANAAWEVRSNAYLIGKTKVGAALLSKSGKIFTGCNVEHIYRCHDIHAEVNAISNMISQGESILIAILIAAERKKFTPCGGCMDWIMQHGGKDCIVAYQNEMEGVIHKFSARELMPEYPF
jgi:cytidine deaminase